MDQREDIQSLGKPFAHRLIALIESQLVTYREYIPWADRVIKDSAEPPAWVIDLATVKYRPKAAKIARDFVNSEPVIDLPWDLWADEFIAALFLRYERKELSWASFLNDCGTHTDAWELGREPACEYFYAMLDVLEIADFSASVEAKQRDEVSSQYGDVMASVRRTYKAFKSFRVSAS